jgi:hypothetical protein
LVLLVGIGLALMPLDVWAGLIRWFLYENSAVYHVGGGIGGILLGAFLSYASFPERSTA